MILSIETSCDETSIAIMENKKIIYHEVYSQIDSHKKFGGVIPELASRMHVNAIYDLLIDIFKKIDMKKIKYISYTNEPGLIGALQIGKLTAQSLAMILDVELIPINHIDGHVYSAAIENKIKFPILSLIISGGHTEIRYIKKPFENLILSSTLDDAAGEAFDKVARKLGLSYPGGPAIDNIFSYKDATIEFTKPLEKDNYNFSFSGLKSSVINYINNERNRNNEIDVIKIASSFQKVAIDSLVDKLNYFNKKYSSNSLVIVGGVAANSYLRKRIFDINKKIIIPSSEYCTDNAAMIAMATKIYLDNK